MPSSVKDRFTNKWESVFFFAKNQKYYFNLDAVRVEPITKIKPKPFNRRIRDAKRLENMNQEGAIVGAEMTEQEKLNTDKLGNKLKQDNVLGADGKPKANYKGFNARWQEKMNGVRIKISDIQETKVGEEITEKPFKEESNKIIATKVKIGDGEVNVFSKEKSQKSIKIKSPTGSAERTKIDLNTNVERNRQSRLNSMIKGKNPGDVFETEVSRLEQEVYGKDDMKNGRRSRVLGFLNTTGRKQNANPNGKNPGDIFNINTKPFPKAHFATFPPALPEKILKCSCPKQVCNKCGKPREPITKSNNPSKQDADYNNTLNYNNKMNQTTSNPQSSKSLHRQKGGVYNTSVTIGYTDCGCNAGFKAGITLDPFFGAGTVGLVAEELGLDWVGIELKEEYTKIARERLEPYTKITRLDKI